MKNKIVIISILIILLGGMSGCRKMYEMNQPKEPEVEYSAIKTLSGEWYVVYRFDDGDGNIDDWYGVGYTPLFTYNTAAEDTDKFWISDAGNFWSYTVKSSCNVDAKTFNGADLASTAYELDVQITNGKIIEDGVSCLSGVKSDSIYFEVEFGDDPGTIYQCSGYRRTGFLEDEH